MKCITIHVYKSLHSVTFGECDMQTTGHGYNTRIKHTCMELLDFRHFALFNNNRVLYNARVSQLRPELWERVIFRSKLKLHPSLGSLDLMLAF